MPDPSEQPGHKHTFFCGGLLRAMTGLPVFLKIGFSARSRSLLTRSSCSDNAAAAFCSRASCRRSLSWAFSASATCRVGGPWRQVESSTVKLLRVCIDHPTAEAGGSLAAVQPTCAWGRAATVAKHSSSRTSMLVSIASVDKLTSGSKPHLLRQFKGLNSSNISQPACQQPCRRCNTHVDLGLAAEASRGVSTHRWYAAFTALLRSSSPTCPLGQAPSAA